MLYSSPTANKPPRKLLKKQLKFTTKNTNKMKTIETHLEPEVYELVQEWLTSHMGSLTVTGMTSSIKLDKPVDSFGLMKAGKAFVFLKKKELLPTTCEGLEFILGAKEMWDEARNPIKINPEILENVKINGSTIDPEKFLNLFEEEGLKVVQGQLPKFIKGQWYNHTEPGQEKFLIRVEYPEKQICSGWDCKGNPFKNEWVHLGDRLQKADLSAGEISVLEQEIEVLK